MQVNIIAIIIHHAGLRKPPWSKRVWSLKDAAPAWDSKRSIWGFQRLPFKIYSETEHVCNQNTQLKENIEEDIYDLGIEKSFLKHIHSLKHNAQDYKYSEH